MEQPQQKIYQKYHFIWIISSIIIAIIWVIIFNSFTWKNSIDISESNTWTTTHITENGDIELPTIFPEDLTQIFAKESIFTKNWKINNCNPNDISIEYIFHNKNTLPSSLITNTIYVLESWEYILDSYINVSNCTAIISSENTFLRTKEPKSFSIRSDKDSNFILYGMKFDWTNTSSWEIQEKNGVWIFLNGSSNNTITDISSYNNETYGIYIWGKSKNNTFSNITIFGNTEWIHINDAQENILENINSFNNSSDGIYIWSNSDNNLLKNIYSYNNERNGFFIKNAHHNTFNNILSFNNGANGFYILSKSWFNAFNNILSFSNNETWFLFHDSDENLLNNISVFNNKIDGFSMRRNSHIIYNILNSFNNWEKWFRFWDGWVANNYYGIIKTFSNWENISGKNTLKLWNKSPLFTDGKIIEQSLWDLLKFKWIKANSDENTWKLFVQWKQETLSWSLIDIYDFTNISQKQTPIFYYNDKKLETYWDYDSQKYIWEF